jgi:hypothetical protein
MFMPGRISSVPLATSRCCSIDVILDKNNKENHVPQIAGYWVYNQCDLQILLNILSQRQNQIAINPEYLYR